MGSIIKLYGAGTGGAQDALGAMDVPMPGHIIGGQWAIRCDLDATDEQFVAQVSFRAASAYTTNDDRGLISEARSRASLITAESSPANNINLYVALPDLPIMGGERLYLHVSASTGVVSDVTFFLHFDFDLDKISMRRR